MRAAPVPVSSLLWLTDNLIPIKAVAIACFCSGVWVFFPMGRTPALD
jgi:hypothetical protein